MKDEFKYPPLHWDCRCALPKVDHPWKPKRELQIALALIQRTSKILLN
jgi:hypothetical protein